MWTSIVVFLVSFASSSAIDAPINLAKCTSQNGFGSLFHVDLDANVLYEVVFIDIDCRGPIKSITHYHDYAEDESRGLVMQQTEKIPLQDVDKRVNDSPDLKATIYLNRHDCQNKIAPLKTSFHNSGSIFSLVGGLYHLVISEHCSEQGTSESSTCLWQNNLMLCSNRLDSVEIAKRS
jgi:hypothetical protein